MMTATRTLLAFFVSILAGLVLLDSIRWEFPISMMGFLNGFAPKAVQEGIATFVLVVLLCLPVGALGKTRAAWFGLLASVVYEAALFSHWLELPPARRGVYTLGYFFAGLFQAGLMSLVSFLWWSLAFRRFERGARQ